MLLFVRRGPFARALVARASRAWTVTVVRSADLDGTGPDLPVDDATLVGPDVGGSVREATAKVNPDLVVDALTLPQTDPASDTALALRVYGQATTAIALAAAAKGSRLVHVSPATIFDGARGPYTEADAPSPPDDAARAHLDAEAAVRKHCRTHLIVRTAPLLAPDPESQIWRAVIDAARGRRATLCADVRANYIDVDAAAGALLDLVELGVSGLYHVGGATVHTEHGIATAMLAAAARDARALETAAPRGPPRDHSLVVAKTFRNLGRDPPRTEDGLARWVVPALSLL